MVKNRKVLKRIRIIASVKEYQSVREKRIDLKYNRSILLFENVADPPHGMNEFLVYITVYLFTKVVYINIYDVGKGIKGIIPNMVRYHGPGSDLVGVPHEILKKSIFLGGKVNLLVFSPNFMGNRVKAKVGVF